jgi:hypothetical protein
MRMLFLVLALGTIGGPVCAQDGHIPGLEKPTDCVMTRIKSIHGRLEGSSPRESGAAVEYENGVYGVQYQLGDDPDKDHPGYSDYWQQKTYWIESNAWCPRLTAAMILSGSAVQVKGRDC